MTRAARLLFVGDIHLGRRPSDLPPDLADAARELSPAAAWGRAVQRAIEERADAVVLAGDVVESLEDRWAAYPHLQAGVERLAAAGVRVLGVAGNHDGLALPRLARLAAGFELLGAAGRWEVASIAPEGACAVRLVAWSFPEEHCYHSPFDVPPPPAQGATLGVLHCDLDAAGSAYAPVARSRLAATGHPWLLGHIHAPDALGRPPHVGYLGSLSPLDPTETGAHGPWMVEVSPGGEATVRQLPLAPLRYEPLEVDASALDELEGEALAASLDSLLAEALPAALRKLAPEAREPLRALGLRVVLVGRARSPGALRRWAQELGEGARPLRRVDGASVFVDRVRVRVRLALNLDDLARGSDPPALLARRALDLEGGGAEGARLVAEFRRHLTTTGRGGFRSGLSRGADDERLRLLLLERCHDALDALLASRPGAVENR